MPAGKTISGNDVPNGIVIGVLVYLLALFIPIVSLTPDLPAALPPASFSAHAILDFHARARARAVPQYIAESFALLGTALARRDPLAIAAASRDFAAMRADATGDDPLGSDPLREGALRSFLGELDMGILRAPLFTVARRHGLLGPEAVPIASRALLIAWFDVRWETFGARENLRDETLGLDRVMQRVPREEARAMAAWGVAVSCRVLFGASGPIDADHARGCAAVRNEFVGLARVLDASYPVDAARAAVDVLFANDLVARVPTERDADVRSALTRDAQDAFGHAHAVYAVLAEHDHSRLLRRYLRGTADAMGL